jgi:hypothetical protein
VGSEAELVEQLLDADPDIIVVEFVIAVVFEDAVVATLLVFAADGTTLGTIVGIQSGPSTEATPFDVKASYMACAPERRGHHFALAVAPPIPVMVVGAAIVVVMLVPVVVALTEAVPLMEEAALVLDRETLAVDEPPSMTSPLLVKVLLGKALLGKALLIPESPVTPPAVLLTPLAKPLSAPLSLATRPRRPSVVAAPLKIGEAVTAALKSKALTSAILTTAEAGYIGAEDIEGLDWRSFESRDGKVLMIVVYLYGACTAQAGVSWNVVSYWCLVGREVAVAVAG